MKSEMSRLLKTAPHLDSRPQTLFNALRLSPYSRLTTWIRVVNYWDWLIHEGLTPGPNPYKIFMSTNRNAFKQVYKRKEINLSYEQVKEKIEQINHPETRHRALQILCNGLRWHESTQQENIANGKVVGKGGKLRPLYGPQIEEKHYQISYSVFRKHLATVGLKPHDLRKVFATKLAQAGLAEADLLKVMGWSSILTAQSYLQPQRDEALRQLVKGAV